MRNVTGVEYGCLRSFQQSVVTVRENVRQRPQHHAVVAAEGFDAAD